MPGFELTVAPNGARKTKADHPALPMTAGELAETARACYAAGAGAIHLHVRDDQGRHSLDSGRYREAIDAIKEAAPGMGIQITTEAAGLYGVTEQFACLEALRPTATSIAVREMARDLETAARVYALAAETGTQVQHILYGPGCIDQYQAWRSAGVIRPAQDDVLFVLGQYVPPVEAEPHDLTPFLGSFSPPPPNWTVCSFGQQEQACLLHTIQCGGHVRIGFENNILSPGGDLLTDNADAVRALVSAAADKGFSPSHLLPALAA